MAHVYMVVNKMTIENAARDAHACMCCHGSRARAQLLACQQRMIGPACRRTADRESIAFEAYRTFHRRVSDRVGCIC